MLIKELKNIREDSMDQLKKAPDGSLKKIKNHGSTQFYQVISKSERKYLSKKDDEKLLKALAQKTYNLKIMKAADFQINCVESFLKSYNEHCIEDVYKDTPDEIKKYITPYALPISERIKLWENEKYITKPYSSKSITFKTDKGDSVRSKSEVIIANKLFAKKIPYRYECKLELSNGLTVYPDFTIMKPATAEIIIWEHFGLMDNPEYVNNFIRKHNTYLNNGYIPGKNIICTFESSSSQFDLSVADRFIKLLC